MVKEVETTRAWTILATSWYGGKLLLFYLIEMLLRTTQINNRWNKRSYIRFHVLWWTAVVDVVMPIDFICIVSWVGPPSPTSTGLSGAPCRRLFWFCFPVLPHRLVTSLSDWLHATVHRLRDRLSSGDTTHEKKSGQINPTCWISPIWDRSGPDVLPSRGEQS